MQDAPKPLSSLKDFRIVARTPTRNKDTIIQKHLKQAQNFTGKIHKVRSVPYLSDSKNFSKCPKKIITDKERLYEENLSLKQMYNFVNDENLRLKTRIQQIEKNAEQLKTQELSNSSNSRNIFLVENLKNSIYDLKAELKAKDQEIEDIKRYIRYTKMQEMEVELVQYSTECTRLRSVIDEIIQNKNILPSGLETYDRMKEEMARLNEELDQRRKFEIEQNNKIESLIIEKNRIDENIDLENLLDELNEKSKKIENLEKENFNLKEKLKSSSLSSKPEKLEDPNLILSKVRKVLIDRQISVESWLTSITSSETLTKEELASVLEKDLGELDTGELNEFWKKYSEGNRVSVDLIICLIEGKKIEKMTIGQIFEVFKARATYHGITGIEDYLESTLPESEITQNDIYRICSADLLSLDSQCNIKTFINFIFSSSDTVSKSFFISKISEKFEGWVFLKKTEIEGILRRVQSLLFDTYEDVISRLQEKTRFQSVISLEDLLKELRAYGIVDSVSEEVCARALIFYYSRSLTQVNYMTIMGVFYECDLDSGFLKEMKNSESGFNESNFLGDSLRKSDSEIGDEENEFENNLEKWDKNEEAEQSEKLNGVSSRNHVQGKEEELDFGSGIDCEEKSEKSNEKDSERAAGSSQKGDCEEREFSNEDQFKIDNEDEDRKLGEDREGDDYLIQENGDSAVYVDGEIGEKDCTEKQENLEEPKSGGNGVQGNETRQKISRDLYLESSEYEPETIND